MLLEFLLQRGWRAGVLTSAFTGGLALAGICLPAHPAQAQVSLNFSFGSPGYNVGYWSPSPYYGRYYSRQLYAQYVMWYYYPNLYYRYYPSPPPPPPYGIPRPPPPPYGAPPPPPPPQFFAGLRVGRPEFYRGAPHFRPGGPVPRWRPAFQPPDYHGGEDRHGPDHGRYDHGPQDHQGYGPGHDGSHGYDHGGPDRGGPDHGGPGHAGPGHAGGPDHGGPGRGGPDHGGADHGGAGHGGQGGGPGGH